MSLVSSVTDTVVPKEGMPGRVLRITVDVDMSAVRDYVMFNNVGGTPWPVRVVDEMMDAFIEIAHRESMMDILWRKS